MGRDGRTGIDSRSRRSGSKKPQKNRTSGYRQEKPAHRSRKNYDLQEEAGYRTGRTYDGQDRSSGRIAGSYDIQSDLPDRRNRNDDRQNSRSAGRSGSYERQNVRSGGMSGSYDRQVAGSAGRSGSYDLQGQMPRRRDRNNYHQSSSSGRMPEGYDRQSSRSGRMSENYDRMEEPRRGRASSEQREQPARRKKNSGRQEEYRRRGQKKNPEHKRRKRKQNRRRSKIRFSFSTLAFAAAIMIVVLLLGSKVLGIGLPGSDEESIASGDTETTVDTVSTVAADTEEETEKTSVAKENADTIELVMVGDVLLHDNVEEYCLEPTGSYNYSSFFTNIEDDIQSADLALVSQEVIIGGADLGVSGYPNFNAPNEMADDLEDAGFNVILHASNHAMDMGATGIINCLSKWNKSYPDIAVLGIHDSEEDDDSIYYYEQDGMKIAIMNYTYGVNEGISDDQTWMVDFLEETKVRADLEEARQNADFVIVCPHWGTEYSLDIDESQEYWTNVFLEEGVDLVIGTHPHVIEPVKTFENTATGRQMLVYYSLGNFVNWSTDSGTSVMNRFIGGMAKVTIGRGDDGTVEILDHSTIGLVCHVTSETGGITVYKISQYTNKLAKKNELRDQDPDFCLSFAEKLCDRVWGNDWE